MTGTAGGGSELESKKKVMFPHLITRRFYLVQKRTTERLKNSRDFLQRA